MEVTKRTGTKLHTAQRSVKIYAAKDCPQASQTIECPGVVFLIDAVGHISAVTEDTLVSVEFCNANEAKEFLQELIDDEDK